MTVKITVSDFLKKTYTGNRYLVRNRIVCKDGFNISIQGGSELFYCCPRELINEYQKVELGYPSKRDSLIDKYAEDKRTIETVYAFVPIETVEKMIKKHGGIIGELHNITGG